MTLRRRLFLIVVSTALAAGCSTAGDATLATSPTATATADSVSTATASATATPAADDETPEPEPGPTVPATPTAPPATAPTPAPPCAELAAGAELVHPSDAPIVVDLDGDGAPDEFWMADSADGTGPREIQAVRSSDGAVTDPLPLEGAFAPFDPVLASVDLDADGQDEVFYSLSGNTAMTGVVVELDGCALRAVTTTDPAFDYGDGVFTYLYFAGGNSCGPTGCYYSVVCLPGEGSGDEALVDVVLTAVFPEVSVLDPEFDESRFDEPIEDQDVVFGQVTVEISDGVAVVVDRVEDQVVKLGDIGEWRDRVDVECEVG